MTINCNYVNDYQYQCYILSNLIMNLKYPCPKPKSPIQRNSFMAIPSRNRAPPGLENTLNREPNIKLSGFANNKNFGEINQRGKSPPTEELLPPMPKKRPIAKRSHQDIVAPLVAGLESKSDFYLYKDLAKEKFESDSLSDDDNQYPIKEEENDYSEEEEKVSTTSSSKGRMKLSNDRLNKQIGQKKSSFQSAGSGSSAGVKLNKQITSPLPGPEKPVQGIYEYKDHIPHLGMTQQGSKYLQRVLTHAPPEVVEFILKEVLGHLSILMPDQYGNYFSSKLFQSCSPQQRYEILKSISKDVHKISCSKSGTHSMQTLIEVC
mmetsp:Transcript_8753/g.9930  ORF Transcript_8753/g.9930 Transcript_8753/m.9930 type:complete len:320 (+) Transcript_8753:721-1680(+)